MVKENKQRNNNNEASQNANPQPARVIQLHLFPKSEGIGSVTKTVMLVNLGNAAANDKFHPLIKNRGIARMQLLSFDGNDIQPNHPRERAMQVCRRENLDARSALLFVFAHDNIDRPLFMIQACGLQVIKTIVRQENKTRLLFGSPVVAVFTRNYPFVIAANDLGMITNIRAGRREQYKKSRAKN